MTELPTGWARAPLSDLADFNPKHDPSRLGETISFVPMPAVDAETGTIKGATDRPLSETWKGFTHFAEEDVIFAKITPCMENGKIALARGLTNGLACGSTEFHVLRPNGALLSDYLWRFLRQRSFRQEAEGAMTGAVGQRRVPTDYLKAARLPVPPLPEQRRIVAKLDALTARTARARADLDRIPALAARYKQAVLEKAFSGELTAEWRRSRGLPPPGKTQLADLVAEPVRNGLSVRGSDEPPGVRSLRLSALRGGQVNLNDVRFLPISDDRARPFLLRKGDVLVSRGNGTKALVGISALVGEISEPTIFPDTAFRLRVEHGRVSSQWLAHIWASPQMRAQIEGVAKTTAGIWKISQADLARMELSLVELAEQTETVRRVESAFAEIDRLTAEAAAARRLLDRLDQAVLAKAFRGELVPQDPADEPASVLLERIRAERAAAPKARRGRKAAA